MTQKDAHDANPIHPHQPALWHQGGDVLGQRARENGLVKVISVCDHRTDGDHKNQWQIQNQHQ